MSLFFRVSGILAILLTFTGAGFIAGEHVESERIVAVTPTHEKGPVAYKSEQLPPGVTLDPPYAKP